MSAKSDGSRPRSVRISISVPRPSDQALAQLRGADRRVQGRTTQIRRSFISAECGPSPTPLSRIVQGGRAAGVRLRLMLAILWLAGGGDHRHEVAFPARAWAELLDLADPGVSGQRRIRDALKFLENAGLIDVVRSPGRPPTISLRREDGSGKPYVAPLRAPKSKKTGKLARHDWSVLLPPAFWTNAWALALSTPGLALLLILRDLERSDGKPAWIAPELAQARFGLSEDTWTRGVRELEAYGLLRIGRKPVGSSLSWKRVRNTYRLRLNRLNSEPNWED